MSGARIVHEQRPQRFARSGHPTRDRMIALRQLADEILAALTELATRSSR